MQGVEYMIENGKRVPLNFICAKLKCRQQIPLKQRGFSNAVDVDMLLDKR